MTIDEADFEAWRANPITQAMMRLLKEEAESAKEAWLVHSWGAGGNDIAVLCEMKGRASICEMVAGLTVEDFEEDDDSSQTEGR